MRTGGFLTSARAIMTVFFSPEESLPKGLFCRSATPSAPEKLEWAPEPRPGWIVPIPVGFGALSELLPAGEVQNARDHDTAFRFVESLYSIGQWISPHRLENVGQLLWYASTDPVAGLYRCRNDFASLQSA